MQIKVLQLSSLINHSLNDGVLNFLFYLDPQTCDKDAVQPISGLDLGLNN